MSDSIEFALHAWVDESIHVAAKMYLMAAVVCEPDCDHIRGTLRSLLSEGQDRLHWGAESPERKEKIAKMVATFDMAAVVVIGTPMAKRSQERARAICMETLLIYLDGLGVAEVIVEQRDKALNDRDVRIVKSIRGKNLISARLRVGLGGPLEEPKLWLPDAVAGAAGAARVRGIPDYLDAIGGVDIPWCLTSRCPRKWISASRRNARERGGSARLDPDAFADVG